MTCALTMHFTPIQPTSIIKLLIHEEWHDCAIYVIIMSWVSGVYIWDLYTERMHVIAEGIKIYL